MNISKKTVFILISLLIIIPIGFYSKFYYKAIAFYWVNNSLNGLFYEIFWCLFLFLFSDKPFKIAVSVLICTCGLEFLQLWHPPFLEFLRSYFIGSAILGTTFVLSDFPYYFIGCGIGYFWMKRIEIVVSRQEKVVRR